MIWSQRQPLQHEFRSYQMTNWMCNLITHFQYTFDIFIVLLFSVILIYSFLLFDDLGNISMYHLLLQMTWEAKLLSEYAQIRPKTRFNFLRISYILCRSPSKSKWRKHLKMFPSWMPFLQANPLLTYLIYCSDCTFDSMHFLHFITILLPLIWIYVIWIVCWSQVWFLLIIW